MSEDKTMRLSKAAKEFGVSVERIVEYLASKGVKIESNPNTKVSGEAVSLLEKEFRSDKKRRVASQEISEEQRKEKELIRLQIEKEKQERERIEREKEEQARRQKEEELRKIQEENTPASQEASPATVLQEKTAKDDDIIRAKGTFDGLKVKETIDLSQFEKPKKSSDSKEQKKQKVEKVAEKSLKNDKNKREKSFKEKDFKPKFQEEKTEKNLPKKQEIQPEKKENILPEPAPILHVETQYTKLTGPKLVEKIDLSQFEKPKKSEKDKKARNEDDKKKPKRKRIEVKEDKSSQTDKKVPFSKDNKDKNKKSKGDKNFKKTAPFVKQEASEEEIQKQVRETLERLQGKSNKSKGAKYRREKRDTHRQRTEQEMAQQERESTVLKVTEFVTVNELATMMDVPVNRVIGTCMTLGIMVTMNQRLDAEILSLVAEEFGFQVSYSTADIEEAIPVYEDREDELLPRAPIVTVMGHVDHGKTSLLDYIRQENVIAGESGGITQHIGAYSVTLENGQRITFLDTPGHEAFTAMRARGASVTDIAIIVIGADSDVMPQTKEAISHAQAAGVPMIFAINKIDLPTANPEKIKERLAGMNLLVEDWGGAIQSHDISAKKGIGVKELLEKVLLEAEMLQLRANPNKKALGTVVEAFLDKGRGYVATVLVQEGTLKVGDYVLAGTQSGKIRAMHDERGKGVRSALPSTPISILGLDGAPQAGDKFYVFEDEKEAKQIAQKRAQLVREQAVRTQRHITLDEIGRRIALGNFKQLNIILKGDVDGSVEALTDSFQKLSTEEIQIAIIHKGVGAITESDVLLASASDAIIIGFNVRPMTNARVLAEKEEIDIRSYSIIYDAINDLKDAMEGMLSPEMKEEITGTAEVRELFKISKVGTIAGCMVTDGKIFRNSKIRLIRENVVIYTGELSSLKRFKDDVKEVSKGYDCGMQIKNYNDLKEYDVIEAFHQVAVKKKL